MSRALVSDTEDAVSFSERSRFAGHDQRLEGGGFVLGGRVFLASADGEASRVDSVTTPIPRLSLRCVRAFRIFSKWE